MCKKVSSRCAGKVGSSRGQRDVLLASVFKLCLFLEHGATEQEGSLARMKCVLNICFLSGNDSQVFFDL